MIAATTIQHVTKSISLLDTTYGIDSFSLTP